MQRKFGIAALLALGSATFATTAPANLEPAAVQAPPLTAVQGVEAQALSQMEMQQITGKFALDSSINLTALGERLTPAQRGQLTQLLVAAQQRGIPLPPALVSLIPNPGGVDGQGTEAQGIEQ